MGYRSFRRDRLHPWTKRIAEGLQHRLVYDLGIIEPSLQQGSIQMADFSERITINPEQCGGRPCIRGMRIRVIDILDLYAAGLSASQILEEMPDLEMDDLKAALQ